MHPWDWPECPWQHIHLDYVRAFMGKMLLIAINAHSKWMEVEIVNSAIAQDIGMGWWEAGGVGGKWKASYIYVCTIHQHKDRAIVLSVKHRNSHSCTCQAKIVVGSSLAPHAVLLGPS